tara:strand:+ start:493 stop:693 length:201 start_codon:yes stop_codon:yes gene_type:complete
VSGDTWFVFWRFLEMFNFNWLRGGGVTWFDSVLPEMAGMGAIAEKRAQNYLMKSMVTKTDRAVLSA